MRNPLVKSIGICVCSHYLTFHSLFLVQFWSRSYAISWKTKYLDRIHWVFHSHYAFCVIGIAPENWTITLSGKCCKFSIIERCWKQPGCPAAHIEKLIRMQCIHRMKIKRRRRMSEKTMFLHGFFLFLHFKAASTICFNILRNACSRPYRFCVDVNIISP